MADSNYISEHSGQSIDEGVSGGLTAVQEIQINGVSQTKSGEGVVNLPAYPSQLPWGSMTGNIQNQTDLNTALGNKLDKNVGTQHTGKFATVDANGNYVPVANPQTAAWGNITGTIGNQTDLKNALDAKVDAVTGKTLTSNDYTNTEKAKVAKVADIEALIPTEATSSNKLADKDYVDNKVATNSGTYKGSFSTVADLPTTGNNNNDYANVLIYSPTSGETIGFARYKWVTAENQWKWEYDNITNSFTPAQNAAIDSGVTAAKVTNYDSHLANTNNPHSVTAAQLGLQNVVNTGDSATPVQNGTTKFTTGGAYTELNKKVDKTITVGGVALSQNVTNQNLFDAIKDVTGTMTGKTINGPDNTLTNIALSSLANQGGGNAGKPLVVGNDGVPTIGDNTPTYINISSLVSGNAYNAAHGSFNHCKMVLQNDMVFSNIDYQLTTPITDKQANIRKILELPALSGQFSYPQKVAVRLTQAICQPTAQCDAYAYYNPSGEAYINPTAFDTLQVLFSPIVLSGAGDSFSGGEPIYLTTQNVLGNSDIVEFNGNGRPIVIRDLNVASSVDELQYDWDICYFKSGTGTAPSTGYYHNTSTNKWYYNGSEISVTVEVTDLQRPTSADVGAYKYGAYQFSQSSTKYTNCLWKGIVGHAFYVLQYSDSDLRYGGCEHYSSYTSGNGLEVTGNFWKLRKVIAQANATYMYRAELKEHQCRVNEQGVWGHWDIQENVDNELIGFGNVSSVHPIKHGIFGIATFVPEPQTASTDLMAQGNIINNTLYIPGMYAIDRIQFGAGGVM